MHQFQHLVNARADIGAGDAKNSRVKAEQFLRRKKFVVIGQFGKVPNPLASDRIAHIHVKNISRAARGRDKPQEHIHGCGLACAVGA